MQLTPWTHPTREGFTLRGWHTAPSGKPVIHFLHGNGFCGLVYEPMLSHLSAHFDLWLCDIQGHGDSDHPGVFLGWNRNAELAVEAFQAHRAMWGDQPVYGVGHSFGGVLTCLIMAEHPELFQASVLLDPVLFTPPMLWGMLISQWTGMAAKTPLAAKARARRRHWPDRASARQALEGRGTYKNWAPQALDAFITHAIKDEPTGGVGLKCEPELESNIFSSAPEGLWRALKRVQTPTTVLHAENTFPFVSASVALWKKQNPIVRDLQMRGGHCFMQEYPDQAAETIKQQIMQTALSDVPSTSPRTSQQAAP